MSALLPCAHCGGAPELEDHRTIWAVRCVCGASVLGKRAPEPDGTECAAYWDDIRRTAIAAWNRRAPVQAQGVALSEREQFEAAYRKRHSVPAHAPVDFPDVQHAWIWWQARAALDQAKPVAREVASERPIAADAGIVFDDSIRRKFEVLASDSLGFKRSRKGTYVNTSVARDWKWFKLGVSATPPAQGLTDASRDVLAERARQKDVEEMTLAGDDAYCHAELPRAAASYILNGANDDAPHIWPWAKSWWKPKDGRRNYVKAAALLIAEIERLDRAAMLSGDATAKEA